VSVSRRSLPGRRDPGHKRVTVIATAVILGFVVLIGQLWYLQVLEGGRFLDASDKNRIRIRPIAAPRGILYDRNGTPLVDNRPAFTLSLIPRELPRDIESRDAVLGRVASLLNVPYQELLDGVTKVQPDSFLPVRVRRGLTLEDVAKVEEWKLELPGVITEVEPQRTYPNSRFAAHLLGYVREANDEQLKQGRYRRGDMVGQSGLERLLDEPLNALVAIEVGLDILLRSLLIDVELCGQPKRADAIHDTKVDGLSTRARLLIHRCSIDTEHLASGESVDVFTGSVSIKQQWILREVSHQAQFDLRIVG